MKRKDYNKPTMMIVELQHGTHLLQSSGLGGTREGYGTADEEFWDTFQYSSDGATRNGYGVAQESEW